MTEKENHVERRIAQPQLEVIIGSMFSGKTDELIRRLYRGTIAKVEVQAFKPSIDIRYGDTENLHSHSGSVFPSRLVDANNPESILNIVNPETRIVGIEEVQFFNNKIVEVCDELIARNIRVVVAGLPLNFKGEPFGSVPVLLAKAQKIDLLSAICVICGDDAYNTQRIKIIDGKRVPADYNDSEILVGAKEDYEARCSRCFEIPGKPVNDKLK